MKCLNRCGPKVSEGVKQIGAGVPLNDVCVCPALNPLIVCVAQRLPCGPSLARLPAVQNH